MKFIQNPCRNDKHTLLFLFAFWFLSGLVLPSIAFAASYDTAANVPVSRPGSTADFWLKGQSNPFYGGRKWSTPPEWIKRKGSFGVPNPNSGGTPGVFTSDLANIPGYKPGGNVPVGKGVRTPLDPIKEWEMAGNPAHVPAGKGVRTPLDPMEEWKIAGNRPQVPSGKGVRSPESVPGVTGGGSGGSGWFEEQQRLNAARKAAGTNPGSAVPPASSSPTNVPSSGVSPAGAAGKGSGSALKGVRPTSPNPKNIRSSGVSPAGAAGKGSGPAPKSGMSVIGKIFLGLNIINSTVNISTSDNPKEQAQEEGRSWFTGIIGNLMGGLITGGPIGGIIGTLIGVTATDSGFADWAMGNDPDYQNKKAQKQTGPKTIEGQQRIGLESLKKTLPGGFSPTDITPPGTQTAGNSADIGSSGIPGNQGLTTGGASSAEERTGTENLKKSFPDGFKTTDITPPGTQTAAGTMDIGNPGGSTNEGQTADGTSGLEWAQNVNVSKSYQDSRRTKSKGKENLKIAGSTLSERVTAAEGEDQQQKGVITSQGKETDQSIGSTQREGKSARDANKIMSDTSIGTILAGGLMGGLSSGVATGLDNFFGTMGKGAGEQVSVKTGIQPPPPPGVGSSSGTGASAGDGSSGGAGTATGTRTSGGTGTSTGTGTASGSSTSSGTNDPPQNVTMTYAGTFSGTTTVTAAFGKRGTLRCPYTARFKVTLYPNGTATGEQHGGVFVEFDESGNGLSCSSVAAQFSYTGMHANGRVTLNRPNRSYSGQYTTSILTASGGGAGRMTLSGPRAGGKPASDKVSGSMSLSRQ